MKIKLRMKFNEYLVYLGGQSRGAPPPPLPPPGIPTDALQWRGETLPWRGEVITWR